MNARTIISIVDKAKGSLRLDFTFDEDGVDSAPIRGRNHLKVKYLVYDNHNGGLCFKGSLDESKIFIRKEVERRVQSDLPVRN